MWLCLFLIVIIFVLVLFKQLRRARARIRELEQLNMEKDKLFTVIGHDLSGTINIGQSAMQLYRSGSLSAGEQELILDSIEEKFLLASVTLQSLLNWGKLLLKGVVLNPGTFNAAEIIHAELKLAEVVTRNKKITVINGIPADLSVYADVDHFKFIIRNLISNAIKFSRAGGAMGIKVSETRPQGFVVIGIIDSGVGMSQEKLKQIFYPFGSSTDGTAEEKGNGIGLMLCREYARKNGGDIWVKSENGVGTTFFVAMKSQPHSIPFTI